MCSFLVPAQETNQRKRIPYDDFFGYFLVQRQESNTCFGIAMIYLYLVLIYCKSKAAKV